ncbi:unnamed protein product [marine sediment metagenome]|uniref:Uncharacterized protein n=1 Tax=marine sediment metagenome TaxID=412755 RepID=X1T6R9_9ZZZZ
MPEIGEIKKGAEIGYKRHGKYIWVTCPDCGKERWVFYIKKERRAGSLRCCGCAQKGQLNSGWKGGRNISPDGYVHIWLSPDNYGVYGSGWSGY